MAHPDPTADRLAAHLRAVTARYPLAWQQIAAFRRDRRELGDWPRWCYCPLSGAYAVVSGGGDLPVERAGDVAVVGALAAWRATQGIYRLDPDLLAALWETPVSGDLPDDLLLRLPEWCVYVEMSEQGIVGYWAHLEYDAPTGRHELRLLVEFQSGGLLPIPLHLGHGSLDAALDAARRTGEQNAIASGLWTPQIQEGVEAISAKMRRLCEPLVSILLYLCSEAAEIRDARGSDRRPRLPRPVETKHGPKEIPASGPTTWEVGWRIGAALRLAREHEETGYASGPHASPRAHLRRAHWHSYWTGRRVEGQRGERLVLRWVHPTLVGAGDVVPTIHEVE